MHAYRSSVHAVGPPQIATTIAAGKVKKIVLALNQLTVAAALVYWPKPVGKRGYDDDDGFSATAAMMQKYGSV